MTTILADSKAGVMVCDSLCIQGSRKMKVGSKIERHNGALFGFSGNVMGAKAWFERYKTGNGEPSDLDEDDGFDVLVLRDGEISLMTNGNAPLVLIQHYYAIGSGGEAAIAAYIAQEKAGVTPNAVIAVEAACEVNSDSGLPVIVFCIDEPEAPQRPAKNVTRSKRK